MKIYKYGDNVDTDVIIPENVILNGEEIPVKEISQTAFKGNQKVKSITVSNKVTTIDEYAFAGCTSLESIYIPDSVTTIGSYAFDGCELLNNINLPSSLSEIGSYAFSNCSSLTSINIPDSVKTIGAYAFQSCSNLTTVTISENSQLTSIDSRVFNGCSSLTSIYIPDSVTTIGDYAFSNCSNLTIYCEASSEPSGWSSSWNPSDQPVIWNSYKGIYGNFNDFEYIAYHDAEGNPYIAIAGYNGSNTDVVIPEYIEVNEEQIVVEEILNSAFRDNTKITSIFIPDSVTSIGDYAFRNCLNLTIYCEVDTKQDGWSNYWNYSNRPVVWNSYLGVHDTLNGLEYAVCIDNEEKSYIAITGYNGSATDVVIPESINVNGEDIIVKEILNTAFRYNTNITSINIPYGVTSIDDYTFEGCTNLKTVTIVENSQLTSIGDYAFSYCSSLTSIYIPNSVTTIGDYAFSNCSNLIIYCEASFEPNGWSSAWTDRPVVWSSNGQYGEYSGFIYGVCTDSEGNPYITIAGYTDSSTNVVIPSSINVDGEDIPVKAIASNAFSNNGTITSITIPDSVTTIGSRVFYSCSNLTTVTISENSQLTSIGSSAFEGCSSLTSIYIPNSVTTIGSRAFYSCSNLTTVTISENSQLTTIGSYAFSGCSSLTSIYIPDSVTTIGSSAFYSCSNLITVTIEDNSQLIIIGTWAFSN